MYSQKSCTVNAHQKIMSTNKNLLKLNSMNKTSLTFRQDFTYAFKSCNLSIGLFSLTAKISFEKATGRHTMIFQSRFDWLQSFFDLIFTFRWASFCKIENYITNSQSLNWLVADVLPLKDFFTMRHFKLFVVVLVDLKHISRLTLEAYFICMHSVFQLQFIQCFWAPMECKASNHFNTTSV